MRKSSALIVVIVLILLVGGGVLLVANNNSKNDSSSMNGMNRPASQSKGSNTGTKPIATNAVTIQNFSFTPANVTIKKGTSVTWTNKDSSTHTVTETDGQSGPNSGSLPNGKSYSLTFNTTGTFHYHCTIHPEMVGTVTVTD